MISTFTYSAEYIKNKISEINGKNPDFSFASYSDTNGLSIYFIDETGTKHRYSDHPCSDKKGYINHSLVTKKAEKQVKVKITYKTIFFTTPEGKKTAFTFECIN